jgi:HK97 family phage prohead protease
MPEQKKTKRKVRRKRTRKPERRVLSVKESEFRCGFAEDGDTRTVEGYAALYNSRSVDLGGFEEVIEPGAFDGILDRNPDVFALFNHEPESVLARSTSGTLRLSLDDKGLAYSFDMPNTTLGRDLGELMQRGDIHSSSFAFMVDKAEFRKESGKTVRYISKIKDLVDVSVVTTPAYPEAGSAIRSFKIWQRKQVKENLVTDIPAEVAERLHLARHRLRMEQLKEG